MAWQPRLILLLLQQQAVTGASTAGHMPWQCFQPERAAWQAPQTLLQVCVTPRTMWTTHMLGGVAAPPWGYIFPLTSFQTRHRSNLADALAQPPRTFQDPR